VVESLGHGRFLVSARQRSDAPTAGSASATQLAYAIADGPRTWIFLDGRTYVVERDAPEHVHVTDDQVALSAPMPATVISIPVSPGQAVVAGDLLIMLEAMKMELPIRAPRAGRVKALACREGELVPAGVPLIEME
jgi:biotin carboxyl carrier protein